MTNQIEEFEAWLNRTGKSRNTIRMYVTKVSEWQRSGYEQSEWITDEREYGASASNIKMMLAAIRSYNKFAGIINSEINDYSAPPLPMPQPHPVAGGIETVRAVLTSTPMGAHRAAVALGALAGLRVAETIAATRSDIVLGRLMVRGKGGKFRRIPISDELAMELECIETERFVPICNASARRGITKVFTRASVTNVIGEQVSSHDLRATFATHVYNKHKDIRLTQILLGHSQITHTQLYLGVDDSALVEAVNL
ncbi:tyrosine integrase [Gordonia phage Gibbles]|nr:tyrosine integrase [Gordonia phage Gibbles]